MDLDEYTDAALVAELDRRKAAEAEGRCSYCGYPRFTSIKQHLIDRLAAGDTTVGNPHRKGYEHGPCRFPERHGEIPS